MRVTPFWRRLLSNLKDTEFDIISLGIGSFELKMNSRYQFAVALLLKETVSNVNSICYLHDPSMTKLDRVVARKFGFTLCYPPSFADAIEFASKANKLPQMWPLDHKLKFLPEHKALFWMPHLEREMMLATIADISCVNPSRGLENSLFVGNCMKQFVDKATITGIPQTSGVYPQECMDSFYSIASVISETTLPDIPDVIIGGFNDLSVAFVPEKYISIVEEKAAEWSSLSATNFKRIKSLLKVERIQKKI